MIKSVRKENNSSSTCLIPDCKQPLSRYNTGGICALHEAKIRSIEDQVFIQALIEEYKKLKELAPRKFKKEIEKRGMSNFSICYKAKVCLPYKFENLYDQPFFYIEEQGVKGVDINTDEIAPDLFLRFIELSTNEDSYLDFISKYGLFGLSSYFDSMRNLLLKEAKNKSLPESIAETLWVKDLFPENKKLEPLVLIKMFHKTLKEVSSLIFKKSNGYALTRDENLFIIIFFITSFNSCGICHYPSSLYGKSIFLTSSLAGVLILQLFRFFETNKILKVCALPTCNLLTTKKYCCKKHSTLNRQWKCNPPKKLKDILSPRKNELMQEVMRMENIVEEQGKLIKYFKSKYVA